MWQDYVMSAAGFVFAVSMVPTIAASVKARNVSIPYITLIVTVIGLAAMVVCMASYKLVLAVITNGSNCVCWAVLLVLKRVYGQERRP